MAQFPIAPGFSSVQQKKKHYQLMSESMNGRIQVRSLGASRREWRLSWPYLTRAEFDPIYTFLDSLNGMATTFTIDLPDPTNPITNQTVECRIMGEVQEFDIGNNNLVSFELDIVEVL